MRIFAVSDLRSDFAENRNLVIQQQEIIALLQAEVAGLKAELEKFRRPPAASRNSSRPPSLDQS